MFIGKELYVTNVTAVAHISCVCVAVFVNDTISTSASQMDCQPRGGRGRRGRGNRNEEVGGETLIHLCLIHAVLLKYSIIITHLQW